MVGEGSSRVYSEDLLNIKSARFTRFSAKPASLHGSSVAISFFVS